MYDWNTLWHTHQGYRTGYVGTDDLNQLANALHAQLIKPAAAPGDVAVYDQGDQFLLLGHVPDLQVLTLAKHALFDIQVRFVPDAGATPCIEVHARNLATQEEESWRGDVRRDGDGQIWLDKSLLKEGIMPAMPFDGLSFTDHARFRDLLYNAWQAALPGLLHDIEHWQPGADLAARDLARYRALLHAEQTRLRHQLSEVECQQLRQALQSLDGTTPAQCRGLWLHVERWWLAQASELDLAPLIARLRQLDFAQELALIDWLK